MKKIGYGTWRKSRTGILTSKFKLKAVDMKCLEDEKNRERKERKGNE